LDVLLFFDIDATLVTTSRAGIGAMEDAGKDLFGPKFTSARTEFAGRLDPLIIRDLLANNDLEPTAERIAAMREVYGLQLQRRLTAPGVARPLPGVLDLLTRLRAERRATLALLTGNYPETGRLKLSRSGIEPDWFAIHVWGCDAPRDPACREDLPAVGFDRFHARHGRRPDAARCVVIGDTPHDVGCARAHGCRALAVATGQYTAAELGAAGADLAVRDLSGTEGVLAWLMGGTS